MMAQVQNVKLLQEGTGCIAPGESLAESNDSVSPTYLEGATNALIDQDTKLASNLKNKTKVSGEASTDSTIAAIPARRILKVRRRLESKNLPTPVDVTTVPKTSSYFPDSFECKPPLKTIIEESTSTLSMASTENCTKYDTVATDYSTQFMNVFPSTEKKTIVSSTPGSECNSAENSESESDEEIKRLTAKTRKYKNVDRKSMTALELKQICNEQIAVLTYVASKCEDVDERRILYEATAILSVTFDRMFQPTIEREQKRLQAENDYLKEQIKAYSAKLATLQTDFQESKPLLEVLKEQRREMTSIHENDISIIENMLRSTTIKVETMINERFDELEARLPPLEEDNTRIDHATSAMGTSQHCPDDQGATNVNISSTTGVKNKKRGKTNQDLVQPSESQKHSQNITRAQPAIGSTEQRCWCAAGQEKLQLQIEKAIVKSWVSSTSLEDKIDLAAGHKPRKACESSLPRISRTRDFWWTQELQDLHTASIRARRAYTRSRRRKCDDGDQHELYQAYRSARADLKQAIELAKQRGLNRPPC